MSITHLHNFIQSRSDLDGGSTPPETDAPSSSIYHYPFQTHHAAPVRELLDLEKTIREIAQGLLVERSEQSSSFVIEKGRDIPSVTAFRSDWHMLVTELLKTPTHRDRESSADASDTFRFELNRDARSVYLSFSRTGLNAALDIDYSELSRISERVGELKGLILDAEGIQLRLRVSINSGVVAPELRHSEQRIKRMHVHANSNQFNKPTPIIKHTG